MEKINLITPEDIATFDRIDRDCLKMHVCPPPKTFINMKVHDVSGNLTLDIDMPSRSWVRNAYNMMACVMMSLGSQTGGASFGAGTLGFKDTGGNLQSTSNRFLVPMSTSGTPGVIDTAVGEDRWGIVVGTGDTAESIEHYALAAKIGNGTSAGQLSYQGLVVPSGSYDSGTKKWTATMSRIFNNNSDSGIGIKEVAWYLFGTFAGSQKNVMISRDLLSSPVTVASAAQLTVTYTIEMTFPA